jgi:solute carrier family 35 (UDP-sugar transporter), member A1/2/3
VQKLVDDVVGADSQALQMTVPAVLYFVQNNLQYVAVSNLDAATFQVTYQLKILTTALFSVMLLGRKLSSQKWYALLLLTGGIALVQLPTGEAWATKSSAGSLAQLAGLTAVLVACILSGLAGVWYVAHYSLARTPPSPPLNTQAAIQITNDSMARHRFERVLKGSTANLFVRNIQLSMFSIAPGLLFGVLMIDGTRVWRDGFFAGYDCWTWGAIACQAIGGLIVAAVVKYADNILKGFATSLSIILSCLASVYLFQFRIHAAFLAGCSMVLYATHMYGRPDSAALSDMEELDSPPVPVARAKPDLRGDLAPDMAAGVEVPLLREGKSHS